MPTKLEEVLPNAYAKSYEPGYKLWKISTDGKKEEVDIARLSSRSRDALVQVMSMNFLEFDFDRKVTIFLNLVRNIPDDYKLEFMDIDSSGDVKLHIQAGLSGLRELIDHASSYKVIAKKIRGKVIINAAEEAALADETI
jgi:hypothetical protein